MPRPKRYVSDAEKMKAYRERKKGFVEKEPKVQTKDLGDRDVGLRDTDVRGMLCPECQGHEVHNENCSQKNLPVPVLADSSGASPVIQTQETGGEARESTKYQDVTSYCLRSTPENETDSQRRAKLFDGKRNRESVELQCENCGTLYWARKEDKDRSRFCGKICQASTMARETMGVSREIQNKAYREVESAISTGRLISKPCQICGRTEVDAHHEDYSKPLDVIWLCRSHHVQRHMPTRGGQTLSKTDQKFNEDRPGWYIFGKEVKEEKCWTCGKPFKTQLEMNRFCSPKCKNEYLATISPSKKLTLES